MKRLFSKLLGYQFSSDFTAILWLITLVTQFMIYVDGTGRSILGIVLAIEYAMLSLSDIFYVIAPMAVVANSSLGTVIGGSISFPFLAMALMAFRLVYVYRNLIVRRRNFFAVIIIILYSIHYTLFQLTGVKIEDTIYMLLAFYFAFACIEDDTEKCSFFYSNIAIVIFLSALQCIIYGGIEYWEASSTVTLSRFGIIGAGSGDSVFSGLLLIIGISICLANRSMPWLLRWGMLGAMVYASFSMISTSTVIAMIVLIIVYNVTSKSLPKAATVLMIILLILTIVFQFYIGLPEASRIPALDALLDKTILKYEMLISGNLSGATTLRSDLTERYTEFFVNQSAIKKLLGGNSIPNPNIVIAGYNLASHNTYIDLLLRFGYIGFCIIFFAMITRYIRLFIVYKTTKTNGELFLINTMLILYSYSLSIYYGVFLVYWMVFLFFAKTKYGKDGVIV